MAAASEINSLEEINYRSPSKLKTLLVILIAIFLMLVGFLNFYPIGDAIRKQLRTQLKGSACNPDFTDLSIKPLFAKVEITNLTLPPSCLGRGENFDDPEAAPAAPLVLDYLTINYHLINFFPFGLPFRIDTVLEGQPLSLHFVAGIGEQMIRIKDQKIDLAKLMPILSPGVKLAGSVTVDMSMRTDYNGNMTSMNLKAASKDLQLPSQTIQALSFNLPSLKINEFFVEANSESPPRITVERLIAGNENSPIRAQFKGTIDLQQGNIAMSPLNLQGEIAFSQSLLQTLPLLDLLMQPFPKKDVFYQVRLGGTLGQPKGMAP